MPAPSKDSKQPLDQRFFVFMLLSMSILLFFNGFMAPPVDPADEQAAQQEAEDAGLDLAAKPAAPVAAADADADGPSEAAPIGDDPTAEPELFTLGSVAPEAEYRLLTTIDNIGAAVRRVAIASPEYQDLDDRSGFLGHLELSDSPTGGALVGVVEPGSPAEEAGLAPGDVITSAGVKKQEDTPDAASLHALLDGTEPRETINLIGARADGEAFTTTATLRRQPLCVLRPEAENIALHGEAPPGGVVSEPSYVLRLKSVGGRTTADPVVVAANAKLTGEPWTQVEDDEAQADDAQVVAFRKRLPELGIEIVKRFTMSEVPAEHLDDKAYPGFHFDLGVEVRNLGAESTEVSYELTGPNGLPIEGWWYSMKIGRGWGGYGMRDVLVRYAGGRYTQIACKTVADGKAEPMGQGAPLAYIGVDSQYFASVLMPQKESLGNVWMNAARAELATPELDDKAQKTWNNPTVVLERKPLLLSPAGAEGFTHTDGYRVFAGPKLPDLLAAYHASGDDQHGLDGMLYYGWFGPVAWVMLGILHGFYAIVGNYGVAIILLTVLVRASMYPISRKQAQSMVKMQALKPEMDRIAEKYKNDMEKRSRAQQDLFRKHKVNPAAGCLPLFLQLPVFAGLYRALGVDVELRQAPLFSESIRFCSNLAAPDMAFDWSGFMPDWVNNGQGMFGLGPYFNVLPIVAVCLFLVQQKLFMPEATTEQARMQQSMMKYMMLFMGFLFFKWPSGLAIYLITSTLWGITERKLLPKPTIADAPAITASAAKPSKPAPKASSNGASKATAKRNKKKRKR
ncbi:Membrane protein insertase YidC [Pseudobythopirellula maris]|uniref:Membrane protein insertase YidC n=1 Tax=Pseudobythopirellula maris TaxID=2527991 RepID=A0A5C5ZT83_9BACT|nr:YidC/Oxa1 family insertase periplasmic-domain containing protein [Pseudobythopirellula maris]TWT90712.1 Membrane protein insertase YidC [Pseudobythopirellula maris]